jgi:hypothetical protein
MAADAAAPGHAAGGTQDELLLTVEEAARRLRIGRTLVYQLISFRRTSVTFAQADRSPSARATAMR